MDLKYLQNLKYFVAVYETKGFSRACIVLGTVQSNVSTRVKQLEDLLGVVLFERRYRHVVPTQRAEQLYPHAKELLAAAGQTASRIRGEEDAGVRVTKVDANAA